MKKLFTFLLTLSVVVAFFSLNAFASTDDIVDSGSCGADVTYKLYSDGELVISGTGDMANYLSNEPVPWYMHKDGIQKITISLGICEYNGLDYKESVNKADQALYKAKQTGRNKSVAYSNISNQKLEDK